MTSCCPLLITRLKTDLMKLFGANISLPEFMYVHRSSSSLATRFKGHSTAFSASTTVAGFFLLFYSIRSRKATDRIACKVICARKSKKTKIVDYYRYEDGSMVGQCGQVFNGTLSQDYRHMATDGNILCVNQLQDSRDLNLN